MPSTASAGPATATARREQLARFLAAIDAFHAAQQAIEEGKDPETGAPLPAEAKTAALDAATARLTTVFHAAIETAWQSASATARQTLWGGAEPPAQAARVLESEVARQKAFASRFALDIARGETEEKRKIPEATRAALYADAAEAAYQVGAALGGPDGMLIWWVLAEASKSCFLCPIWASSSPYSRESLPALPRDGTSPCIFTPESLVLTRRGDIPIREVVPGDEVWTHRSRWRTVLRTRINPVGNRRGVIIDGVGFTEEHKIWTADGWISAADVRARRLPTIHLQHAKNLREMFEADALGSPYEHLPSVRELLSLRDAEGPSGGGMPVLWDEPEGQGAVGQPGESSPDSRGRDCPRQEGPHALRGSDLGEFPGAENRGRPLLHELLGRRSEAGDLSIPLGLDESARANSCADGSAPHKRGSDGRPAGESGDPVAPRSPDAPRDAGESPEGRHCARASSAGPGDGDMRRVLPTLRDEGAARARRDAEVLLPRLRECREDQAPGDALPALREDLSAIGQPGSGVLLPGVLDGRGERDADDGLPDVRDAVRVPAAQIASAEVLFVEMLPPHVYDLEVEEDQSFLVGGIFAANCRARCKCHLDFRPAPGVTPPPTPEEKEKGRRFEERILNPPPTPPGKRLPTPEERGVLRDLEIQRNFARRKQADAEAAGRKDEARLWQRKSSDLTGQLIDYSKERGVHHVPTLSVKDVINGQDVGQRDIDRLTHFRGIDGVTVSRAQVAAIQEAVRQAKADVLKVLEGYPAADAVSREEWRQLLRENGAPPSAFGGELFRLGRESCEHHDHHEGEMRVRLWPVLDVVAAIEARVPEVTVEVLPSPADVQVVNIVGETVRETLENHVAAYALLGAAGRRTGVEPYRVEVGPFDDWDLVAVGGTWVQGDAAEVRRFLQALRGVAADFAVATWQPMG